MSESNITSPHWLHNQDGLNGTAEALHLKPLLVLDAEQLTLPELKGLEAAGFKVPEMVMLQAINRYYDPITASGSYIDKGHYFAR